MSGCPHRCLEYGWDGAYMAESEEKYEERPLIDSWTRPFFSA